MLCRETPVMAKVMAKLFSPPILYGRCETGGSWLTVCGLVQVFEVQADHQGMLTNPVDLAASILKAIIALDVDR